jgi:hypothetical protein
MEEEEKKSFSRDEFILSSRSYSLGCFQQNISIEAERKEKHRKSS